MWRIIARISLVSAGLISIVVVVWVALVMGIYDPVTWAIVAAGMAVLTSAISAWVSQRVLELQEDEQKPFPYPSIDVQSRYGLVQLCVANYGKSTARDIQIVWDIPLVNAKGEIIRFTTQANAPDIPILLPGERMYILVDGSMQLFQAQQKMEYTGKVEFKTVSGSKMSYPFFLSVEKYRTMLTFTEEEPRTMHELQKIPGELHKISREISHIHALLRESKFEAGSESNAAFIDVDNSSGQNPATIH